MTRTAIPALVLLAVIALAVPVRAANPCSVSVQKHQLDLQKHQLDLRKHQIDEQYRGPANAAYRESLKRQLEAQKHQIDFQKHQLDLQKHQCEAAFRPHKRHLEHHDLH